MVNQLLKSSAQTFGDLLRDQMVKDPHFYLFSPDETTSNKLDAVFQVSSRTWNLPIREWDLPESTNGRIVELLSENVLFSCLIGHLMNCEQGMMTSYEAFFAVITSQILQQIKFFEQSSHVHWRPEYPAVNLLSTSTCWRQDHNGFSHQSPILISTLLNLPSNRVNCLFPVDSSAASSTFQFMLNSQNVVNLTTFNKTPEPQWLDVIQAQNQLSNGGASVFEFASDSDPDFVLAAAGDIASREALFAIAILKQDLPTLRLRFVNIGAISYNAIGTTQRKLPFATFDSYFKDKPIIANFHGYPQTLQHILGHYSQILRPSLKRPIIVHGFSDRGSTTTPFEMLSLNQASRYHLAIDIAKLAQRSDLVAKYQKILAENTIHARQTGLDLPEITDFKF